MNLDRLLAQVQTDRIQFATVEPEALPGSRRVVVTAPADLITLSQTGKIEVLEGLIALLKDPERAWAAEVVLAAMTGVEEATVNAFSTMPQRWWRELGATAYERWQRWLEASEPKLTWDASSKVFTLQE